MSTEKGEELQVVNYGIGGHYEPHTDFLDNNQVTNILSKAHFVLIFKLNKNYCLVGNGFTQR